MKILVYLSFLYVIYYFYTLATDFHRMSVMDIIGNIIVSTYILAGGIYILIKKRK